jgi:predicted DNA-binding transcriptional regulator YafY
MPALQDQLQATRSTVYRLRRELEHLFQITIVYDRNTGGFHIDADELQRRSEPVPGLFFSTDELIALASFEQITRSIHSGLLTSVLSPVHTKLQELMRAQKLPQDTWQQRIKITPIRNRFIDQTVFKLVVHGVISRKRITLTYPTTAASDRQTRTVSPQTLIRYKDNWYLDGWCHLRNGLRTFALSRIEAVTLLTTKAREISAKQLKAHYEQGYGIFDGRAVHTATIRFSGSAASSAASEQWHPQQKVVEQSAEAVVLSIPYSQPHELIKDVLACGECAEVLEPQELRDAVRRRVGGMMGVYFVKG